MRLPRLRAALVVAVLLPLGTVPLAGAASGPLTCSTAVTSGDWQRLAVPAFPAADGVAAGDTVTAFSVDAGTPQDLLVSNGAAVQRSTSHGCDWRGVLTLPAVPTAQVPVSGATARIVALAELPGGAAVAAVQDGSGSASRPRVLSSPSGDEGSWTETSSGLPAQGVPRVLAAAPDGSTAYLAVAPVAGGGGGPAGLPGLPGPTSPPAGLLYASTDGGRTWQLRTGAGVADAGFDALSVDPGDAQVVYGLSGGRLLVSSDGGGTFVEPAETAGTPVTGVAAVDRGQVAAVADGLVFYSDDSGATFRSRVGPGGAAGVAARAGTGTVLVESAGALFLVDARGRGGAFAQTDPGVPVTSGSLRGGRGEAASYHALAGGEVLRYVDPPPPGPVVLPPPPGDLPPPPPPPGVISPAARSVRLPVGTSTTLDFRLQQPRSPTPLDMFVLLDASESVDEFRQALKNNLPGLTDDIVASGVDLHVGLGIFTAGPRTGEPNYPAVDPGDPGYRRPDFFRVLRQVAPPDDAFRAALQEVRTQRPPSCCRNQPAEGGLFGLQELVTGQGLVFQGPEGRIPTYQVPPGQTAGFRGVQGVRRLVVHIADDAFTDAYGTPLKDDGRPDVERVGRLLAERGVNVVGIGVSSGGGAESTSDLRTLAQANGTFAPDGGVDCGDGVRVEAGEPMVCDSTSNIGAVVARLVQALADRQTVALVPRSASPVLGAIDASRLADLDVTVPTDVPFSLGISCVDVAPGQYRQEVDAVLRGTTVASAVVDVTCLAAPVAAEVPPRPDPPLLQDPAPPAAQPAAQAPPAPVPAPPVVQPQAQPQPQAQTQVQAQVNPMTAAALQQQEELALALALQADERTPSSELAMVDRRRGEQLRAQALLYVAMAGCAALGLARLRTSGRPDVRVRRSS